MKKLSENIKFGGGRREVGTKFGFDSVEYEKAGGTHNSAFQRVAKKATVRAWTAPNSIETVPKGTVFL